MTNSITRAQGATTPAPNRARQPGDPGASPCASQPTARLETVASAPGTYHDRWDDILGIAFGIVVTAAFVVTLAWAGVI